VLDLIAVAAVGGGVALAGSIGAFAWYKVKQRREGFQAWAAANGFAVAGDDHAALSALEPFRLFTVGRSQSVKNVLRGQRDVGHVMLCDFHYVTGGGKNQSSHVRTVCVVRTPGRPAPTFQVRRQRPVLDSVGRLFGGQDLDFPDDPAFSKAWVLQGPDEEAVRRFVGFPLRGWLTESAPADMVAETEGERLLVHLGRALKPADLGELIVIATNLRRHWS
jgi:hypothetical protein